ncbi:MULTISPECIES: hypothetical protein [unclassified Microcoleus]|uniref:hypothetical protein n=1 Tax=unclassified Microcoleus TaxID=2642155 RepID=UPI001DC8DB4F|nr:MULTISPECIES: hypothetical protein [unclassified Microcoleus]MCC3507969.1 hypothetical protein [Microcoleus sp. PH2017_17_BER_D_A]TAE09252.1 MAG: hypothetical protein EAZ94_22490 [Oscillatoriales cyanobacterium]MCC3490242.1 hypothetical protein [Microcoleus sp. PH2017_16_JOR_D_A]MCC3591464.1 hypothetical protein [Microcoleus sp. PH2017_28_MFU_U_A]TAE71526.1 MAG: hypothetical protein EAZ86_03045 [Oscillatoriales cyanobacterium]
MLVEKSTQLIELSQKKINLQRYATNLQGFQSRQQQIEQAVAGTIPLVQCLRAFHQRGLANFALAQKADTLLIFITDVEAEFKADPEWIIDNENFNKKNFTTRIEQLQNSLREQLNQSWQCYRNQNKPSTNNEILNLLDKVSAFKPTVQRIRSLDWHIQESNSIPQSIEDFEKVDRLIEQLKQCWDGLNADEVPEAVLRFLRVAANEGATLSLLTPEVKDWLAKNRLIDSLRIRLT